MSETILTCIVYGESGFKLLQRAEHLAKVSGAALHVLVFDPRSSDHDGDRLIDLPLYANAVRSVDGKVTHIRRPISHMVEVLEAAAKEVGATQIIIGQRIENAAIRLLGWSTAEAIMDAIPFADLHIVPQSRAQDPDSEYEPGAAAFLVDTAAGHRELSFEDTAGGHAGLFFRERGTDFDAGSFIYEADNNLQEVTISDGRAV